ncbi:putative mechanosensitive ion channel [Actinoplanes missouriensis 431]|uniref:Large-conductance mechanosensitive channel n=2 Tax=Actinoplanes missouriensis TaxID=1866 RepID=I0GX98_ACTM4|nr:putative mechanosensitive ion channel [Actinoplanes missouriensis 431]
MNFGPPGVPVSKMLQGFKDFIMRGNVVDLAVGVVIGAAFTTVVTSFTNAFLKPLIQLLGGGTGLTAGTFEINKVPFDYASFINALITFLLTAAVLYFLVVFPLNRLAERRRRGEEPPPKAPSEEVKLLTEIRDALLRGQGHQVSNSALDEVLGRHSQQPPR